MYCVAKKNKKEPPKLKVNKGQPVKTNGADENGAATRKLISGQMHPLEPSLFSFLRDNAAISLMPQTLGLKSSFPLPSEKRSPLLRAQIERNQQESCPSLKSPWLCGTSG